jgi:uncharacterized protein (TIGR03066 family)
MKTAAAMLALSCVLGIVVRYEAAGPPVKRSNAQKIVGTWIVESVKGDKLGTIVLPTEFTKNGKMRMVMGYGEGACREDTGAYTVEGDKLVMSGATGGKAWKQEATIKRLTASEMVLSYDGGKKEFRLVPFKP